MNYIIITMSGAYMRIPPLVWKKGFVLKCTKSVGLFIDGRLIPAPWYSISSELLTYA